MQSRKPLSEATHFLNSLPIELKGVLFQYSYNFEKYCGRKRHAEPSVCLDGLSYTLAVGAGSTYIPG